MPSVISMEHITKVYENGVIANDAVFFSLKKGEIHALMGENGAGKSTLMNILFGVEQPTAGKIKIHGTTVQIKNPHTAIAHSIGMVPQHFMLLPSLSIVDNVILGIEPSTSGWLNKKKALHDVSTLIEMYNFQLNPRKKIEDLTVAEKQKVEILKSLARGSTILILDEPTAVLTPQETEVLFAQLKKLKGAGYSIIFISHKLREVKEITDTVSIMRKGKMICTEKTATLSIEHMAQYMVDRDTITTIQKPKATPSTPVLHVRNLQVFESGIEKLKSISFSIRRGEILGIAGVAGNGQEALMQCLWGLKKPESGTISLQSPSGKIEKINDISVWMRRKKGLAMVPDDRNTEGVASEASIAENIIANRYKSPLFTKYHAVHNRKAIEEYSNIMISKFQIVCNSVTQKIKQLSGGNVQKIVIAREIESAKDIFLLSEPTRGIDIGAATFIHQKIIEKRDKQTGILLLTSDLNEVLELSDSIIVIHNGEIIAYIEDTKGITEKELGKYMLGIQKQEDNERIKACHGT